MDEWNGRKMGQLNTPNYNYIRTHSYIYSIHSWIYIHTHTHIYITYIHIYMYIYMQAALLCIFFPLFSLHIISQDIRRWKQNQKASPSPYYKPRHDYARTRIGRRNKSTFEPIWCIRITDPLDVHTIYDDLPQIKRKYRTLALKYHPDKHPDNPSIIHKFHLLSTATNILTNADVRPHYDRWLIEFLRKTNDIERNKLIQKLEESESSTIPTTTPHPDLLQIQRHGELLRKLKHFNLPYGDWKHLNTQDQENASQHPYYDCSTLRIVLDNFLQSNNKSNCLSHLRNQVFITLSANEIYDIYFSERNNYSEDDSIIIYTVFDTPITAQHVFRNWSSGNLIPTVKDISPLIPLHYYSDFNLETELNDDIARLVSNEPILLD